MTVPARARPSVPPLVRALLGDAAVRAPEGVPEAVWERALVGPAAEFLRRPGKAVRARVVELGAALAGGAPAPTVEALATVIEVLHAGSLIVDDVQDAADERRGGPALHHVVGTPIAINTGNWMYFWALARLDEAGLCERRWAAAARTAVHGLHTCHLGQALDLGATIGTLAAADVPAVVAATTRMKTGALMAMAARMGAIGAGATGEVEEAIASLGEGIGIGLQMLDDLGGLTSPARAGKAAEDLRAGRPTWPWAWLAATGDDLTYSRLVQRARVHAHDEREVAALAEALRAEVEAIGRAAIRAQIDGVLAAARATLGDIPALDEVAATLEALEVSYG